MKGYNCSSTLYEIPEQVKRKVRREKISKKRNKNGLILEIIIFLSPHERKKNFIDYKGTDHSDYPNI